MKRAATLIAFSLLFAVQSFAAVYIVVLKDGTTYPAKAKWTIKQGKAIVLLENGQSLQLDPALIDVARSEQMTRIGLRNANIIDLDPNLETQQAPPPKPSLGSQIKLRQRAATPAAATPTAAAPSTPVPAAAGSGTMSTAVLDKFERAFENVGIFEKKIVGTGSHGIRAEMTVDTEERVFNAISAASFLMVRNAGVDGAQIDMVEIYMRTTTGGAAGRFQMTRDQAIAIDNRSMSQQEYFVKHVIY